MNNETSTQVIETLKALLGSHTVAYRVIFAKAIGNVPAAIMLSQGFFWQESADFKDITTFDGKPYFQKTAEQWYDATGLTEEQQKTARKHLGQIGMMNEKRAGIPALLYYNIDFEVTVAVIYRYKKEGKKATIDNRSKKRKLTRHSSGKLRGQFAVINGGNNKESLESDKKREKETLAENKFPPPVKQDSAAAQKKEKPLPGAGVRVTVLEGYEDVIEQEFEDLEQDLIKEAKKFDQRKKSERTTKQKPPSDGVIAGMVQAFEYEHKQHFKDAGGEWIGFTWQPKEFPALQAIRKELEKRYLQRMQKDPVPENIIDSWALFLRKAATCDKFILDNLFTPSKIWGQFQSIVQKIHTNNGRPPSTNGKLDQNQRNALALENMVRDINEGRF